MKKIRKSLILVIAVLFTFLVFVNHANAAVSNGEPEYAWVYERTNNTAIADSSYQVVQIMTAYADAPKLNGTEEYWGVNVKNLLDVSTIVRFGFECGGGVITWLPTNGTVYCVPKNGGKIIKVNFTGQNPAIPANFEGAIYIKKTTMINWTTDASAALVTNNYAVKGVRFGYDFRTSNPASFAIYGVSVANISDSNAGTTAAGTYSVSNQSLKTNFDAVSSTTLQYTGSFNNDTKPTMAAASNVEKVTAASLQTPMANPGKVNITAGSGLDEIKGYQRYEAARFNADHDVADRTFTPSANTAFLIRLDSNSSTCRYTFWLNEQQITGSSSEPGTLYKYNGTKSAGTIAVNSWSSATLGLSEDKYTYIVIQTSSFSNATGSSFTFDSLAIGVRMKSVADSNIAQSQMNLGVYGIYLLDDYTAGADLDSATMLDTPLWTPYSATHTCVNGWDQGYATNPTTVDYSAKAVVLNYAAPIAVTLSSTTNGSLSMFKEDYCVGDKLVVNVSPEDYYLLSAFTVNSVDKKDDIVSGKYTVNALSEDLVIGATFIECTHNYDEGVVTTQPTCTADGVRTFTCSECGHSYTAPELALGHNLVEHAAVAATCTSTGSNQYWACSKCDAIFKADKTTPTTVAEEELEINPNAHDLHEVEAKAPTCTEVGYDAYLTCSRCSYNTKVEIEALGHDYKTIQDMSNILEGHIDTWKYCANDPTDRTKLAETFMDVYDMLGHLLSTPFAAGDDTSYSVNTATATVTVNKMSTGAKQWCRFDFNRNSSKTYKYAYLVVKGNTEGLALGAKVDTLAYASVSSNKYDSKSGNKQYKAIGTDTVVFVWDLEELAINSQELAKVVMWAYSPSGVTSGSYQILGAGLANLNAGTEKGVEHNFSSEWASNASGHAHVCSCGAQKDAAAHTYGEVAYTWTEVEGGWSCKAERACTVCAYKESEEVAANYVVVTPAACEVAGSGKYTAEFTNVAFAAQEKVVEIAALEHDYQWIIDTAATITATGLRHEECTICHTHRNDNTVIPMVDCEHQLQMTAEVPATCTAAGKKAYYTCSECHRIYEDAEAQAEIADLATYGILAALDHDLHEVAAKAPTCEEAGWDAYQQCSRCEYNTKVEIEALGHDYQNQYDFSNLASNGYIVVKSVCSHDNTHIASTNNVYVNEYNVATHLKSSPFNKDGGFSFDAQTATISISTMPQSPGKWCRLDFNGSTNKSYNYAYIVVKGNTEGLKIVTKVDGDGNPYDSKAGNKTNKLVGTDTVIYVWDLNSLGIDSKKLIKVVFMPYSTTATTGSFQVLAGGLFNLNEGSERVYEHNYSTTWVSNEQGHAHVCSCGEQKDAAAHTFGEWQVVNASTCVVKGSEKRVCSVCSYEETRELALAAHTLEEIPAVAATCTAKGSTAGSKCSVCQAILDAPQEVDMLAHTEEVIAGKAATCTEKGLTEGKKCSVCGEILVAQQEIDKLAHTEEVIPGKAATCTEKGLTEGKKCSVCGEILVAQEEIAMTAHTEQDIPAKEATCTEKGLTAGKKCSVCGAIIQTQQEVAATGHKYGEWKVTKEATYDEAGSKEKVCSVCGDKVIEVLPKLDKQSEVNKKAAGCLGSVMTSIFASIALVGAAGFISKRKKETKLC